MLLGAPACGSWQELSPFSWHSSLDACAVRIRVLLTIEVNKVPHTACLKLARVQAVMREGIEKKVYTPEEQAQMLEQLNGERDALDHSLTSLSWCQALYETAQRLMVGDEM